jgi:phage gp46-like protein
MSQDIQLLKQDEEYFDLTITDGDFTGVVGFDTAINVSLLTDARAINIPTPGLRRGYVGDILTSEIGRSLGSTLWTFSQARLTTEIKNEIRISAEQSLNWMVEDNIAKAVSVSVSHTGSRTVVVLIEITTNEGKNQQYEVIWRQTYGN